jgi:hypothetical protein
MKITAAVRTPNSVASFGSRCLLVTSPRTFVVPVLDHVTVQKDVHVVSKPLPRVLDRRAVLAGDTGHTWAVRALVRALTAPG